MFDVFSDNLIKILLSGGVGVMPTDTVYGLVCLLENKKAVEKIYKLKKRPQTKPIGTILISSKSQISNYLLNDIDEESLIYEEPTSVIINVVEKMDYAHRGLGSLAFRIPKDRKLLELVTKTGPLATSSANIANQPVATTIEEAKKIFGKAVDFYVDGGDLSDSRASRIIKVDQEGNIIEVRA